MTEELYKKVTPLDRWLITFVVMSATLMQVIDTTIVNVALPHMQGSLGASSDEITWTLTSYLVSSAIFMPLTGYLSDRLGRKRYLIISIAGFTLASALCGASVTLAEIVIFRLLQGVFGAGLVPLSQAILADIFPPDERGKAMAIWGVGVMVGPILGPTLGGYLTDVTTWRWTFYVNVPVGLFTLLLTNILPDTPKKRREMDWLGLILISMAIGGLQYVLDRGNSDDWFNSTSICIVTYLAASGLLGFFFHSMQEKSRSVFDLKIFKDRNFAVASILLCIFGLGLYGMMVIQPIMMEGLLDYPALTTGLMMAPRGISGMISMLLVGRLITHMDARLLIIFGILISVIGMAIGTYYSIDNISPFWLIFPMLLQGFGLGMVFVPLSTVAYSTLSVSLRTEAAGLFSLLRTIGSSIGISIAVTIATRGTQLFWNQLGGFITPYNPLVYDYLAPLHLKPTDPLGSALLGKLLFRQAQMLSFVNVFAVIMWCFICMIPLVLLIKKVRPSTRIVRELAE
ncbi:putative multidrug resistance protein EmrY [Aquicella siphonis]|uniref:Putative multidrug resistance protein EmrY n=1 Tax=Aquicella siphonis TaxID=254247 RepID=A0A5E4PJ14_9COXI|nr:DHA2 family efflux MFS transporter permease subunit [Aquicella siphonis]VVC76954.1 putative multidrug resistance protein EmrY [Aquicella siphonis]